MSDAETGKFTALEINQNTPVSSNIGAPVDCGLSVR